MEKYKRYRVRYTATVDITCYIAAPSKEAVEKRLKEGVYWDQFAVYPCERGDILECIDDDKATITHVRSEDPGDQLLVDEDGNILKQVESDFDGNPIYGDVNPMSDEYGYIDPSEHLINDYSKTVRRKQMPRQYALGELSTLSPLAVSAFKRAGFETIEDLAKQTEKDLLRKRHIGRKAIKELKIILDELGYELEGN